MLIWFLALWAIWGAVVDYRYQLRGGTKPSRRDKVMLSVGVALVALALTFVGMTAGAGALGTNTHSLPSCFSASGNLDDGGFADDPQALTQSGLPEARRRASSTPNQRSTISAAEA